MTNTQKVEEILQEIVLYFGGSDAEKFVRKDPTAQEWKQAILSLISQEVERAYERGLRFGRENTFVEDLRNEKELIEEAKRQGAIEGYKDQECWIWNNVTSNGYGQVMLAGKNYAVHRLAYLILNGQMPEKGMTIDHLCRNKACVNPRHLEAVTNRENVLRGVGLSAKNALKKKCKNGHPFTEENTYRRVYSHGLVTRTCKICRRANRARRRTELKGEESD